MKIVVTLYNSMYFKIFVLVLLHYAYGIDPERELLNNGTIFAIFTDSAETFTRLNGRQGCVSWGGSLATIKSLAEDALVFSLTNATHYQCWIGLDRNPNVNFVKGSEGYSWEDGSDSTYRKYSSNAGNIDRRYVKFRPNNGDNLAAGWIDANNGEMSNCYLCGKLANSRECAFTDNGFCYRSYEMDNSNSISWYAAQSRCEEVDANLASIASAEENILIFIKKPINSLNCWIGMIDSVGGNLTWNDGTAVGSYTNFGPSPPSTPYCVEWNTGGSNGIWTGISDSNALRACYICKRMETTVTISGVRYETLYNSVSVFGYFYSSWPGVTWNTALQECIGWGGSLASIESAAEDGTLYSLAAGNDTQCWIGLEVSTRGSESIIWVDGSDSSYRNYPGQTPTITSIDKYYSLRSMNGSIDGGWNALNMAETLSCFYCKKLANQRGCELTYNGSCYRTFETNTALNWNDSQSNCMSWGGDLASITSQQENDLLFLRTPNSAINCWIGLTDVNNNNGSFQWIDGEQFTYENWLGGIPNSAVNSNCTQSKIGGMDEWENLECNSVTKCYICKRDVNTLLLSELQRETMYNGSIFSYYTTTGGGLFAGATQLFFCIHRGGNLATIDSAEVDQLLYDLAVSDDVECWIGLEKRTRGNETSIWADGSVSTYRSYPGQTPINDQITEFYSLRAWNGNRTSGWEGYNPRETLKCFICQLPVNIKECQFTNDGFCYRTFLLVNPTINWFDAQSNCVMWGGNLASITSEDENTLLFLRTPYRADDCWIGLISTNMNNGAYHWIDGEMFNYDMWASGAPNNIANTDNCARNKVTRMNEWNNYNCNSLTDSYICKRSSNAQFDPDLGELFGELINGNLGFKELKVNTILYRNVTLICGDVIYLSTSSTNWIYSQSNDLSMNNTVNPTNFGSQPGITFISVFNSQQGFYQCRIQKQNGTSSVYAVGVFDLSVTTVAEEGFAYNYTLGIDRTDILLLCVPMNNSIDPINYIWRIGVALTKNNPILVPSLPSSSFNYVCEVFGTDVLSISLSVREPRLTFTYNPSVSQTYTQLYPNTIQLSYQGFPQIFTLSSNIEGRWKLPDGTYQSGSSLTYPYLFQQYTGLYTFYLYHWDGVEVPAFQINVATHNFIGSFITNDTTYVSDSLANGSSLFITENITTVLCVGPNATTAVEWYIHSKLNSNKTQLSTGVGVTRYNIDIINVTTPIYLTCEVDESETYTIFVARRDSIIQVINFDEAFSYTSGSSEMLYYTNPSIPNSLIHWTTESVMEGDNQTFNPEFTNPFPLSLLFSVVGAGQHNLTCFYRNSPAMVLGRTDLSVRDTTTVTLSYSGSQTIFSDETNPSFPNPVPINIQLPTSNVIFTCSLQECIWRIVYTNSTIRMVNSSMYTIDVLSLEDAGIYSLFRTTDTGNNYITALISMNVLPASTTITSTSTTAPTSTPIVPTTQTMSPKTNETLNGSFNPIIIAVPIIIVIVVLVIIVLMLLLFVLFFFMRRKKSFYDNIGSPSKTSLTVNPDKSSAHYVDIGLEPPNTLESLYHSIPGSTDTLSEKNIIETRFVSKVHNDVGQYEVQNSNRNELGTVQEGSAPNYQNLSDRTDLTESTKTPKNIQKDIDLNYMTIDESTLVPLEGEEVSNSDSQTEPSPHYVISNLNELQDLAKTEATSHYTIMHPVTANKPIATTTISAKEFSKTYADYVKSGLGKDSSFHNEFLHLDLECKEMSEIPFVDAMKPENKLKNTYKNIFPFDENRVLLISPNYDCDYINASWINQHQFIATVHPSKDTLRDFLHMIYQTEASMVVMLTTRKEKAQIIGGVSSRVCYWPKNADEELECENFICKLSNSTETSAFIKNELILQNTLENKGHSFIQCISPIWNEDSTLVDFNCVVSLLSRIIKQKQDIPSKPIIIHCEDGIAKTGVLMTVHNAIDEMNATKVINIFNNVKKLRRTRMHVVPTLACYTTCYSLLNEYCSVHL